MIFAPGVRCECVLSVLVHLWISTSNAHTQHGWIFNIKVARFNHHYLIAGPYSEHVEHGWCYGDTKSCSLLCLKGLLIFIFAFCLNILCPLTHIHFLQFALRGMMEALYLELRADKPDSKVGNFLHRSYIYGGRQVLNFLNILKTIWNCVSPAGETDNNSSIHCWHWSCQEAQIEVTDHDHNWAIVYHTFQKPWFERLGL